MITAEDKIASSHNSYVAPSKKGLWIFGRAVSGKSFSCIYLFNVPYASDVSIRFPLTFYDGEKNIYMDDGTVDYFKNVKMMSEKCRCFTLLYE